MLKERLTGLPVSLSFSVYGILFLRLQNQVFQN